MDLTDEERGILLTKMADESAASMLERKPAWVRRARAFLTGAEDPRQAQPTATFRPRRSKIVEGLEQAVAGEVTVTPKRRGRPPKLRVIENPVLLEISAADVPPPSPGSVAYLVDGAGEVLDQIDIEEAIAAAAPPVEEVVTSGYIQVMDEPRPARATGEWPEVWDKVDSEPNDATEIVAAAVDPVRYDLPDIPAAPGFNVERVKIVERHRLGPTLKQVNTDVPPLPPQVARWTSWFLRAGWTPREVAHLFDVQTSQLPQGARP